MEILRKYTNTVGLILVIAGLIALRIWTYKKYLGLSLIGVGLVALIVYFALNLSELKQSFRRKSFIYSSNLFLMIALVLGIVVIINIFLARHHYRFDFTEAKLHSLSDKSVQVLKNLNKEVTIRCFFREGNFNRSKMEDLLHIYAYHSGKIKYEFIDPDKNPGLVKRYEVSEDGTSIFECGDKESRITTTSEEDITNAIIKVTRERKKVIYFLEGHGEASIEDSEAGGYSQVKSELEKLGYEVKKLTLALADNFPKDLSLLVIPGPRKDLLPNELETIRNYLKRGGRVFFMIDPQSAPGLKPFLQEFGIQLEDDLVVDTVSRLLGGDYFMPVVSEYEYHPITRNFRYATFFPYARSVNVAEEKPEGVVVEALAKTSPNSWSERQLNQREVTFNQGQDVRGPINLAVVASISPPKENQSNKETANQPNQEENKKENKNQEKSSPEEKASTEKTQEETKQPEGRLAVFGDSDFVTNRYYNLSGNGNFFLNTVNWLTEEEDLISIQPKTQNPRTINMTPTQGRLLFFVSIIILPLLVLTIGLSIWLRRRTL
ncbi:MAG: Gldg family protein [Candidatus Aminicenantes bacterium]|nr:Gldg family protein [Candidatus Aminicenantes bacterium]